MLRSSTASNCRHGPGFSRSKQTLRSSRRSQATACFSKASKIHFSSTLILENRTPMRGCLYILSALLAPVFLGHGSQVEGDRVEGFYLQLHAAVRANQNFTHDRLGFEGDIRRTFRAGYCSHVILLHPYRIGGYEPWSPA